MSYAQRPAVAEKLIWRETMDGIVIIDPSIGKVRVLNGIGSVIWKLIAEDQKRIDEIIDHIVTEYEVDVAQASQDLHAFLEDLTSRHILKWAD